MLTADPKAFALILLNRDGTPFLERTLDYFERAEYAGQIVIADSSHAAHAEFVAASPVRRSRLRLEVMAFPPAIELLDKLEATLERVPAEHVLVCANDDFVIPGVVESCVSALAADATLSCVRGRSVMFELKRDARGGVGAALSLYPMRSYLQDDTVARLLEFVRNYSTTIYSVQRRRWLIENVHHTRTRSRHAVFFQYLTSALAAVQGRILCLDEPFYVRQGRPASESGRLRAASYEHWPLLITAPDFSRQYQEFRQAVFDFMAGRGIATPASLPMAFDRAAVGLFERGFCGREFDNPDDVCFFERVHAPGSPENAVVRGITDFAAGYPETY